MLNRLAKIFIKPPADPAIATLYGACVTAARQPAFYVELGAPDTVDGRFDLLLLHVILAMRRMAGEVNARQQLFELMFADIDRSLREMGVSDMRIGKRMRPLITAFYGRSQAYEKAMAGGDAALSDALQRNIYGNAPVTTEQLKALTNYVRHCMKDLAEQPITDILAGRITFPPLTI